MGALEEGHCCLGLENGSKLGPIGLDVEGQQEIGEIEGAVKTLLQGLDEDINREGLIRTPRRVALAFMEGTSGYRMNVKEIVQDAIFPEAGLDDRVGEAGGNGGLVVVRDLGLFSYCELCLLPFQVNCHVAYVPAGQRVVGLSKLSRAADVFAKRLQDPQRLADEVCSALHNVIKPAGVCVILQCQHIHFPGSESSFKKEIRVCSGSGVFEEREADIWGELLGLLRLKGFLRRDISMKSSNQTWCPSLVSGASRMSLSLVPSLTNAVDSIIRSVGENPSRKELIGTPARFLRWLMKFKKSNLEMKLNGCVTSKLQLHEPNGEVGCNQKIFSVLNLPFCSQCEHHLLPFHGVVHIGGYFCASGGINPVGKPLLQSIVHFHGSKLQVQERLTRQIAETVAPLFGGDVMVVVEAKHTCMVSRGIGKFGSHTATVARLGRFLSDPGARALFMQTLPAETPNW
ncbi:GTP cyclohydrolase 1-like protein [Drosera capensis]